MTRAHARHGIAHWEPLPPSRPIEGRLHLERGVRYVYDNAPGDSLVADPLEWASSTYHDALGLTLDPWTPPRRVAGLFRRTPSPRELHAYASTDSSVCVAGTRFPTGGPASHGLEPLADIEAAVALMALWWPPHRQRWLVAVVASERRHRQMDIAAHLGVTERTVQNAVTRFVTLDARRKVLVALADDRLLAAGRTIVVARQGRR